MRYWKIENFLFLNKYLLVLILIGGVNLSSRTLLAKEVVDYSGAHVKLVEIPSRVVTLAPSLAELVVDLLDDGFDRLVGVSEYSDYPPALKKLPSIGPYHRFNLEKVISLKPDLVLATFDGNSKDQVLHLRELGVPVVIVGTQSFQEIQDSMRLVGLSLGRESRGVQMAKQFKTGIEQLQKKVKARKGLPLRVMLQVGDQPLVVVGKGSFLHSALEAIETRNIYFDTEGRYPKPSLEDVLKRNPDVIVVIALGEEIETYREMAERWKRFSQLKAVSTKRVYVLKSDALLRPTLRFLEGLTLLDRLLY